MSSDRAYPTSTGQRRTTVGDELARAGFTGAVEIGRGGFGVVYRCEQEALDRTVAVKLLQADLDAVSRERFFREGRAMGGLSGHPNVVEVLQVGVTDGDRPFIVMPFQTLDSLAQRLHGQGPFPWPDALRLGIRLAGALQSAHQVGTLHRDIKPANVLMSDYGEPQLTDFGIARVAGGFETTTESFTGSLSYTAPEVLAGGPPSPASDTYSLGAVLFAIIAGQSAYERRRGEEVIAQYLRITRDQVPDLRIISVPHDISALVERAMAKHPADRPASALELGRELQRVQCLHGLPATEMALPVVGTDSHVAPRPPRTPLESRAVPEPRSPHPEQPGPDRPATDHRHRVRSHAPGSLALSRPVRTAPRRGVRAALAAAAVVLVVLLSAGAAMLVQGGPNPSATAGASTGWRVLRDAPTARQQVATTVADGTVWVLGGLTEAGASTRVEGYDPAIDTWKSAADLPVPLHHAAAVTYRGEVVVLGGWQPEGADLTAVESDGVYAQRDGGWVELPPMLSPRVAGAATVVGDLIVVSGGQAEGRLIATTEVFDGTSWRLAADLPTPREHLAMVTDGTHAYAVGGRELSADRNTAAFDRFDPATDTWERLPDLPAPRGGAGAAVVDGRLVVVGGEEPTGLVADVAAYDLASGTWSALPPMPTPRHGMAVGAVGDTLFALGGATQPSHAASTAMGEALDVPPRRTQPAPGWSTARDAPVARQFAASAVVDGTLWVAGGLREGDATAQVLGYDQAIDTWKAGPDLPVPLHHAAAVAYRGELVVLGGWAPAGGDASAVVSDRVFALRAGSWVELPPLPRPRVAMTAAAVGEQIVVAGGQSGGELLAQTDVFDGDSWTEEAPIPTPREHLGGTTDGAYLYTVGGRELSADRNSAAFERFDPRTGGWERLPDMPTPRGGVGVAHVDGRVVAAGGEEPTRVLDVVEAYDLTTGTWTALPSLGVARHGMSVAGVGNTVVAVNGAARPTHAESVATVGVLTFS